MAGRPERRGAPLGIFPSDHSALAGLALETPAFALSWGSTPAPPTTIHHGHVGLLNLGAGRLSITWRSGRSFHHALKLDRLAYPLAIH